VYLYIKSHVSFHGVVLKVQGKFTFKGATLQKTIPYIDTVLRTSNVKKLPVGCENS
jgi:hypothetical protein